MKARATCDQGQDEAPALFFVFLSELGQRFFDRADRFLQELRQ